jgi:16S rRNA (guanine966-N2)-methyltransferase
VRVVAGSAKGVRLARVPPGVRPVSDMAREGLFSSLGRDVVGARVLDLFAGTGAMAIEALSRGADHAVLVERDRRAVRVIEDNLQRTGLAERADLIEADVVGMLTGHDRSAGPFALVLADPPYAAPAPEVNRVLAELADGWLVSSGWIVALTRPKEAPEPILPVHWLAARRLSYGDTLVLIFQEA